MDSSETRVAPIKTISVSRLELCGAHLEIKLLTKIKDVLELSTLPQPEIYGWTDSTIVLQWIAQLPRTWTSFVANRISEIQQILPRANWNHVKSNSNPADCASRGTLVKDLIDTSLWWHGPDWLSQPESTWPQPSSTVTEENKQQIESEKKHKMRDCCKCSYSDFIHEFQDLIHLEAVPNEELVKKDSEVNFLPHHCVHKKDPTTTKLRVVFDGSAKSSTGVSLNGSLMVGPTVQEDMFSILIRFRFHKVGLSADIAKMYRQIALESVAKDFHRIL